MEAFLESGTWAKSVSENINRSTKFTQDNVILIISCRIEEKVLENVENEETFISYIDLSTEDVEALLSQGTGETRVRCNFY